MNELERLQREIGQRWRGYSFVDQEVALLSDFPGSTLQRECWVDYESMRAVLLKTVPGEVGELLVAFPAGVREDNRPYMHRSSGRIITVLYGSGICVVERMGDPIRIDLVAKTRVWIPEDTLHTFVAGNEPMLVYAQHVPWVPLEDPSCLTYPEDTRRGERLLGLI